MQTLTSLHCERLFSFPCVAVSSQPTLVLVVGSDLAAPVLSLQNQNDAVMNSLAYNVGHKNTQKILWS